jgi:hypothetical protein
MLVKPLSRPFRRAICQHVDHLSTLQVHNDRPVAAALSPAPVIDADHPNGSGLATLSLMAFELPQNGIVALWEAQTRHQPLRRPPPRQRDRPGERVHSPGGFAWQKAGRSVEADRKKSDARILDCGIASDSA